MFRPISIVQFERCYLGSLVLGFITLAFTWNTQMALLQRNPATAQMGSMVYGSLLIGLIVGAIITLVLWYFAARRASVVAKWIIVVFFAIGVLGLLNSLSKGMVPHGLGGVLTIANIVLQAVAVYLLFRPDATAWFAGRRSAADMGETFR